MRKRRRMYFKKITRDWCNLRGVSITETMCEDCDYRGISYHSSKDRKKEKYSVQCLFENKIR